MKMGVFFGAMPIRRDEKRVLGNKVKYSLYTVSCPCACFYVIEVKDGRERKMRCFGKDKRAVIDIYQKIVACSVTSCTLDDIADDFTKEFNFVK